MVVSAAKLEANRRNSQRSTGPTSDTGKRNSSLNAVTHGLRAKTLVLGEEDPQVLEDRREAWRACLLPGDDVEERLVEDAVVYTWMQDRARRAQAKRINANLANFGVEEGQANEKEVEDLGRRLFTDRQGPLPFYPTGCGYDEMDSDRYPSTSFAGNGRDDPDRPSALVVSLQSTLLGCEWMLGEWAKLKAIIDRGQPWLSHDKLKAVRLLGKQPFDAIDEQEVALVFLASYVLKGDKGWWYWEIQMEMNDEDTRRFRRNAADRQLRSLKPKDADHARQVLLGIIERATERLTKKAEAHRERARVMAALVPDLLAFDDTPGGERLRRFDLANGRGLARSLAELRRRKTEERRLKTEERSEPTAGPLSVVSCQLIARGCVVDAVEEPSATNEPTAGPLSVVSSPLPVAACNVEVADEPNATNEPTAARKNVTNEPTVGPLSVVSSPLIVGSCVVDAVEQPNAPNEPTAGPLSVVSSPLTAGGCVVDAVEEPSVPNEPTAGPLSMVRCPLPIAACNVEVANEPNATNEPTGARENVTNEPTAGPFCVVRCPLPVVACNVEVVDEPNPTSEPTVARGNVTNEPTTGPLSVVSGQLIAAGCVVDAVDEPNVTNEPTALRENATNEPTGGREDAINEPTGTDENAANEPTAGPWAVGSGQLITGGCAIDAVGFSVADCESIQKGCEQVRLARTERLRQLNEQARREAEAAMALRRARLREQRNRNRTGKRGDQSQGRAASSGQRSKTETTPRKSREPDDFVKMVLGLCKELSRAPS